MPGSGRRYRPPAGFPYADDRRGRGRGVASAIALHALVLFLILRPAAMPIAHVDDRSFGLAVAPRGGGGGGSAPERLRYIVAPPPPPRVVRPRVPTPIVPPRITPPTPVPAAPAPTPTVPSAAAPADPGASSDGGAGAGAGPGTGGGVGAGAGGGTGPGTGGTPTATKTKAYPIELPAAGLDAPRNVHPSHLDAVFEVTETGAARLLSFTSTSDGGFNRRLRDELSGTRFHAAALSDGTRVMDTVRVSFDLQ